MASIVSTVLITGSSRNKAEIYAESSLSSQIGVSAMQAKVKAVVEGINFLATNVDSGLRAGLDQTIGARRTISQLDSGPTYTPILDSQIPNPTIPDSQDPNKVNYCFNSIMSVAVIAMVAGAFMLLLWLRDRRTAREEKAAVVAVPAEIPINF